MGIHSRLDDNHHADIIIAGGGTSGCVIAGRLAEARPDLSILLIEQGQNNHNVPSVIYPALFPLHLAPNSKTTLFYKSTKAAQLADRELNVPTGGTLGGGSSINWMMYTRAQQEDYDSWNTPGWSTKELLPHLKKFETYHGQDPDGVHGTDGPMQVSDGVFRSSDAEDVTQAAAQLGWKEAPDMQKLDVNNGTERWKKYISPDGKRQDAAHAYIHPGLQSGKFPNLRVLVETLVVRVLFDDTLRAIGVECVPNPKFSDSAQTTQQTTHSKIQVMARKKVIVTSGTLGTPAVLERSGLGDPDILNKAGISPHVNLPGVGADLQDHPIFFSPYKTSLDANQTLDGLSLKDEQSIGLAIATKPRSLGWNGTDVGAKIRPRDVDVAPLGSKFKTVWNQDFQDKPNRPLALSFFVFGSVVPRFVDPTSQTMFAINLLAYPYSRGSIHVTGPNVGDALDFRPGYLSDTNEIDVKAMLWLYKAQREILRRTEFYRGELAIGHPEYPKGSKAACIQVDSPLRPSSDIEYSREDDEAIEKWMRANVTSPSHVLGTAKMAPSLEKGVVDSSLNVYGTKDLKVADMSIVPVNVGSNTQNSALLIGEKASDIILGELAE